MSFAKVSFWPKVFEGCNLVFRKVTTPPETKSDIYQCFNPKKVLFCFCFCFFKGNSKLKPQTIIHWQGKLGPGSVETMDKL